VKALLAGLIAATCVLGTAAASNAAVEKVVIKTGYPYTWHGAHYRYHYGSGYYNSRVKVCRMHVHRQVCTWKYR
jgi:ABC-type nitrate/sulfonate/bicarbonate transport system substrate-binding protein